MIHVLGVDWQSAPLAVRETCAAAVHDAATFMREFSQGATVNGCVLLQTCNRFEIYIEAMENFSLENEVLCNGLLAHLEDDFFFHLAGENAIRRLMEVASGLRSQILGEEQILTQVRTAVENARKAQTTTAELETLFRIAVTAGKEVRTQVRFRTVPTSSAHKAVELATAALQGLQGKKAVVIGNGEIGRLAAGLLTAAGCDVTVTLRSYRHGETVVPPGCKTIAYENRLEAIESCDLLLSATKSPHFTITKPMFETLTQMPTMVIDMAVPRDIDPKCGEIRGLVFHNMDDLRDDIPVQERPEWQVAQKIIEHHLQDFAAWRAGRAARATKMKAQKGKLAIFAGTSEGRALCAHLSAAGVAATAFVATEYGNTQLPRLAGIDICVGRLDCAELAKALQKFEKVVDATHPYAQQITRNLQAAAKQTGTQYLRLVRPQARQNTEIKEETCITVPDTAAAVEYLSKHAKGSILLTTGSKELAAYAQVPHFAERVYARVLPDAEVIQHCLALGLLPSHLICMQGPFSQELNEALLRTTKAEWLVTKDTGKAGGLLEKLSAAEAVGTKVVMIARPAEPVEGYTLEEICCMFTGGFSEESSPNGSEVQLAKPCRCEEGLFALLQDKKGANFYANKGYARFPLFVSLAGKPCLVVGGGNVGERRCKALLQFGAKVTLIDPAPGIVPEGVQLVKREYRTGDVQGMVLAVAATDSRDTNKQVASDCHDKGIPVSVADCPAKCSFYFPALCNTENLTAGLVSRNEKHRLVAKTAARLREVMEELDF